MKGRCLNTGRTHFQKGHNTWNKGKKLSEKHRLNLSIGHLGQKPNSGNFKKGQIGYWKGKENISAHGSKSNFWKGGIYNYTRKLYLNQRRRIRRLNAKGSHTFEEWQLLKIYYRNMCLCCKRQEPEISLTEDHIIPLSMNGTDYIDNIQPLCKSCNCKKYTKIINFISNYEEQKTEGWMGSIN